MPEDHPKESLIEQGLRIHRTLAEPRIYRPLTDRELVQRWLVFARPTRYMEDEHFARSMVYFGYSGSQLVSASPIMSEEVLVSYWQGKATSFSDGDPTLLERAKRWWDIEKPKRTDFRDRLNRIRRAPRKAVTEMSDDLAKFRKDLLVVPRYRRDGPNFRLEHYYFPLNLQAGYGHVLDLLLDDKRQVRSALGRCEFCNCLYLVSNTHKKYCSKRCAKDGDRIKNTERVAEFRKRQQGKKRPARKML